MCSQECVACVRHMSHVCGAVTNPQLQLSDPENECSQSQHLSVYMFSNAMMRMVLLKSITWAVAACSSQGRKWKELHPSVQMWVRERSLENWASGRAHERGRNRRMSSFIWGSGWKKRESTPWMMFTLEERKMGGMLGWKVLQSEWVCTDSVQAACQHSGF